VPPGPRAAREAEKVRTRLLAQLDERRNPRTNATLAQLLDRHLKESRLGTNTTHTYGGLVDKHVLPFLGKQKVGSIEPDVVDSLYAELQRCRDHCSGRSGTDHRTQHPHDCDERCRPHQCRPLAASSIRQVHWILSGAFRRAIRWRWIATNPLTQVEPPSQPPPTPRPPTGDEAAKILEAAWADPDWGMLVWLLMVTGQRRGELCALRWSHVDMSGEILHLQRSIGQRGKLIWEKDTKTHQDRRIVLDSETLRLLTDYRARCEQRASAIGVELDDNAFVFSLEPDGSRHLSPDSVTQRYRKMTRRLGIKTSIHKLRHYSATELIAAGVDIRTVAGRLGHGSGGTTTLRTYAAWVSESDQRAANNLAARMPAPPPPSAVRIEDIEPTSPYEKVAVELRDQILNGTLTAGLPIPPIKKLARDHGVAVSTVHRAVSLLKDWGLVELHSGRRTLVRHLQVPSTETSPRVDQEGRPNIHGSTLLDLEIRRLGEIVSRARTESDPKNPAALRGLLTDAVRRCGDVESAIGEYEMVVRPAGGDEVITTFVASAP
jgi:integrase/DNA-binding transcriptional regulator YhcF (GntR family)